MRDIAQSKKPSSPSGRYCLGRLDVELHAHAGPVPDVDEAVLDDRIGQAVDDLVPPVWTADRIFEGDVVLRQGGRDLDQGGQAEQSIAGAVRRHQDAVQIGVLGDPFELGDAADIAGIGSDDVDRLRLDQIFEVLAQVDLLAGVDRRRGAAWSLRDRRSACT